MTLPTFTAGQLARAADLQALADAVGTLQTVSSTGHAFNVKDYGAKGDASTNDTAAIQAALTAAAVVLDTNYYGALRSAVYFPPGDYRHTGLDLSPRVVMYGDGPGACSLTLKANSNRSSIRVLYGDQADPANFGYYDQAVIRGMTIYGNNSNQTVGHGIEFVDPIYTLSTRYCAAGSVENVNVIGAKEHGIYGAQNRNSGNVKGVRIKSCGGDGLHIEGYDWQGDILDSGSNGGYGLIYSGGAHSFSDFAIYGNTLANVYAYGKSWLTLSNGTLGSSDREAVILGNTDGLPIHLSNVRMAGSSGSANNTYAIIRVDGDRSATLTGCEFIGQSSSVKASYIVRHMTTPARPIHLTACYWPPTSDTTGKPYATAEFSHPEWIYGTIPVELAGVYGARVGVAGAALGELRGNGNLPVLKWQGAASSVNYTVLQNGATGVAPRFTALSSTDTNVGLDIYAQADGAIRLRSNQGVGLLSLAPASAVNWVQVTGAATTVAPAISANGSDAAVTLKLLGKSTGGVQIDAAGGRVGFYGTTPAAKPTATGSRGGNAALASLLTALAGLGLITDSTTA